MNTNQKIGRATLWSSITEVLARLITPLVNMVLARLLVPEAFGVVATITMVVSFAEVFTDAGFQKYIVQHEFESDEKLDASTNVAFWTNLSFSGLACLLIFLFRHPIASLAGSPGLGNSISVASIAIILVAFSSIQMARYKRDFDFKTLFFVRIGTALIPVFVTIPLAIILRNYWALLIGTLASQLFSAVVLTVKSKWHPKFTYSFALLKEMFSFSAWTLLESISIWLTSYADVFIVGNYLNEYYTGLYKTSMTTVNAYMAIITGAITPVLFSALSRFQNDEAQFKSTYYTFQRLTAVLVVPMGIGMFLFKDLVTSILLGSQWMEVSEFMGIWGLTSAFTVIFSHFASEVYRSKGQPKVSLFLQVLHLIFLIPALIISVRYGFRALYLTRSLLRLQIMISALIMMHCIYKFKFFDTVKNTVAPILSALLMGVAGYGLLQLGSGILWQLASVGICIVVYFTALFLLFPKIRRDVLGISYVQKVLKKLKRQ